ncbi:MAG: hypothetical protein ACRETU_03940 [Steroidobacterales bacterium]
MSRNGRCFLALALGCALAAFNAQAGLYVGRVVRDTASGAERPGIEIYLQDGMARVEDLRGKRPSVTIFRDQTLYVLDPKRKTVRALTKADIDRMAGQVAGGMSDVQRQMQAELAKLPPDQRAKAEKMMQQHPMPGTGISKPRLIAVKDAGRNESVNGKNCHVWNVLRDDVLIAQHCVVPYGSLAGSDEMRTTVARISAMTEKLTQSVRQMNAASGNEFSGADRINGVAVLTRTFTDGEADGTESIVTEWATRSNPASLFDVPAGYTKPKH